MQKLERNASILLWSIFLSLTIWIAFISISSQISKNLKENIWLKDKINIISLKEKKLNEAIETNNFNNIELSDTELIIFEKNNYYNIWLKENEEIRIKLSSSNNMTIKLNTWSPVSYLNSSNPSINWIVTSNSTFSSWNNEIVIKNLWWYSNIDIMSEVNFETENKRYKIIEKIGNKVITKENWKFKIF